MYTAKIFVLLRFYATVTTMHICIFKCKNVRVPIVPWFTYVGPFQAEGSLLKMMHKEDFVDREMVMTEDA